MRSACQLRNGGSAPATLGFNAVAPEWRFHGAADAAPAIPAAESALGSHPCVALSSAQVLPEWTTSTPPCNDFSSNGANPLNFVSHARGSLHAGPGERRRYRRYRTTSRPLQNPATGGVNPAPQSANRFYMHNADPPLQFPGCGRYAKYNTLVLTGNLPKKLPQSS